MIERAEFATFNPSRTKTYKTQYRQYFTQIVDGRTYYFCAQVQTRTSIKGSEVFRCSYNTKDKNMILNHCKHEYEILTNTTSDEIECAFSQQQRQQISITKMTNDCFCQL